MNPPLLSFLQLDAKETLNVFNYINDIQYNEWGKFTNILNKKSYITTYDKKPSTDYGNNVYCFDEKDIKNTFKYEFDNFVARVILSNDLQYYHFKNMINKYDHFKIIKDYK